MRTTPRHLTPTPTSFTTTAAQRRRRHLAVYHRALRAASTPDERAAVSARYRRVLTGTDARPAPASVVTLAS
ncbi:MAG: hypothetical protein HKN94_06215 [Acidimicrobiales bacterium]|nr:hypothetical protein [Acidimicrobiales bacterium]RZV41703.1 MAG: hypothetical protein EX269_15940 [Acidimicrobiales bacterium]